MRDVLRMTLVIFLVLMTQVVIGLIICGAIALCVYVSWWFLPASIFLCCFAFALSISFWGYFE